MSNAIKLVIKAEGRTEFKLTDKEEIDMYLEDKAADDLSFFLDPYVSDIDTKITVYEVHEDGTEEIVY